VGGSHGRLPYVSDDRQLEAHTAEPLVHGPSRLEVKTATAKLKEYQSPGSDQIQAGGKILLSAIHKLVNSIWNKEELLDQVEGEFYCTD
jgi:hypothetical protein